MAAENEERRQAEQVAGTDPPPSEQAYARAEGHDRGAQDGWFGAAERHIDQERRYDGSPGTPTSPTQEGRGAEHQRHHEPDVQAADRKQMKAARIPEPDENFVRQAGQIPEDQTG